MDIKEIPVVAITGPPRSGKDTLARDIKNKFPALTGRSSNHFLADHLSFALPLYELVAVKRNTAGMYSDDRKLFAIHKIVERLLGTNPLFGSPSYDEFIELVYELKCMPLDGDKPRSFLVEAATLLQEYGVECFVRDLESTIKHRSALFLKEDIIEEGDSELPDNEYIAVISDLRFKHEAEFVRSFDQSIIIKLEADEEVLRERHEESGDPTPFEELMALESSYQNWSHIKIDKTFKSNEHKEELTKDVIEYLNKTLKIGES